MDDLAGTAPIASLFSYDLTGNGNHDIVVGRDDGKLQTYAVLDVLDEPELIAETVRIFLLFVMAASDLFKQM